MAYGLDRWVRNIPCFVRYFAKGFEFPPVAGFLRSIYSRISPLMFQFMSTFTFASPEVSKRPLVHSILCSRVVTLNFWMC